RYLDGQRFQGPAADGPRFVESLFVGTEAGVCPAEEAVEAFALCNRGVARRQPHLVDVAAGLEPGLEAPYRLDGAGQAATHAPIDQNGELIATNAVGRASAGTAHDKVGACETQELVARLMAATVVDRFQAIDVVEDDADAPGLRV